MSVERVVTPRIYVSEKSELPVLAVHALEALITLNAVIGDRAIRCDVRNASREEAKYVMISEGSSLQSSDVHDVITP
jgi:hypothetical protein